jgi:hypothetical protein
MIIADGFDKAFIGTGSRCGCEDIAVYDANKCIEVLMKQGMTDEEAVEYFEYNVLGSWIGDITPVFLYTHDIDEIAGGNNAKTNGKT